MNFQGTALFCDSDMLFFSSPNDLWIDGPVGEGYNDFLKRGNFSCACVKHNYIPKQSVKMDGCKQEAYPKKNWSSFIIFDCDHEDCQNLTKERVNSFSPQYLHRFEWTSDDKICGLNTTWNFLVGEYEFDGKWPNNIHYTLGSPALYNHESCFNCEFGQAFFDIMNDMLRLPRVVLNKENFFKSLGVWKTYI